MALTWDEDEVGELDIAEPVRRPAGVHPRVVQLEVPDVQRFLADPVSLPAAVDHVTVLRPLEDRRRVGADRTEEA